MTTSPFGNYVIQDLMEYGNPGKNQIVDSNFEFFTFKFTQNKKCKIIRFKFKFLIGLHCTYIAIETFTL